MDGFAGADQFHSTTPGSNFMSYTLPAFSLTSGQIYNAGGGFDAVVDLQPNAALPGSYNAAFYGVSTNFVINAVPGPDTWGLMLSGLALMGAVARRRKQAQA